MYEAIWIEFDMILRYETVTTALMYAVADSVWGYLDKGDSKCLSNNQ